MPPTPDLQAASHKTLWFAPSFLAGAAFGLLESVWILVVDSLEVNALSLMRIFAGCVLAGAAAGGALGLVISFALRALWLLPRLRNAALAMKTRLCKVPFRVSLMLLACSFAAVDRLAYVNLYAIAHGLLTLAAFSTWMLGWTVGSFIARPNKRIIARDLLSIAVAACSLGLVIDGRQDVLTPLLRNTRVGGYVVSLWPRQKLDESAIRCAWEPRKVENPRASHVGYNLLILSIDAFRGDLANEKLDLVLPKTSKLLEYAFRFEHAYAPAPRTTYSIYSMLTGRRTQDLGFIAATTDVNDRFIPLAADDPIMTDPRSWKLLHRYPLGDKSETLARWLRKADYFTAAVVADVCLLPGTGITREFKRVDARPYVDNGRRDHGGETTQSSTNFVREAISAADSAPFFVWSHFRDPHYPYLAYPPTTADESDVNRYESEIRRVDEGISAVLSSLVDAGKFDRTIVVITGDHGEEFRDHGGLYHGTTLYNELIHVPLLVHIPGMAGTKISTPVSLTDLAPTMVDLLGLNVEVGFDGRSLAPLLFGELFESHPVFAYNSTYTAENLEQFALVLDGYKLIEDAGRNTIELFDLSRDPLERENLSDEQPQRVTNMRCLIHANDLASESR